MRSQNLKSYGCQTIAALVVGVCLGGLLLLVGCTGSTAPQFKILTPYGDFDGSTTGTVEIDLRGMGLNTAPTLPPPIDYSRYPQPQLEK